MTDADRIQEVFHRFEHEGLITHNIEGVLSCFSDKLLGIGMGEQGIVRSKGDIRHLLESTRKEPSDRTYALRCENVEIVFHSDRFATLCATVIITATSAAGQIETRFYQSLTLHKSGEDWKICALHASTPVISEESLEAYPLKLAEKTLESLRKKIGEEVYQEEEQFRQAILADTIAFYVINLTQGVVEKSQLNGKTCAQVPLGVSLEQFMEGNISDYVEEEDVQGFLQMFSSENIRRIRRQGGTELTYEYRLKNKDGGYLWASTVLRLITDADGGDLKGILYVRDISRAKRERGELLDRASRDGMTRLYNRSAFISAVDQLLQSAGSDAALIMLDADNFKAINDTYGHPVGDEVLIRIAQTIQAACSDQTWAGRLGGDEFAVFSPSGARAAEWMARLRTLCAAIACIRLPEAPEARIGCSIGVAYHQVEGEGFRELYEKADKALYHSKNNGKGRITVYDEALCR